MKLDNKDWAMFHAAMADAIDSFVKKELKWKRIVSKLSEFREDSLSEPIIKTMRCLCNYNYMRTWPITKMSDTGQIDGQSIQVFIPLADFLPEEKNTEGYPLLDITTDLFEIDGLQYSAVGDTGVSNTDTNDVFFTLILRRLHTNTGDIK